jgi:hypothetical protein
MLEVVPTESGSLVGPAEDKGSNITSLISFIGVGIVVCIYHLFGEVRSVLCWLL